LAHDLRAKPAHVQQNGGLLRGPAGLQSGGLLTNPAVQTDRDAGATLWALAEGSSAATSAAREGRRARRGRRELTRDGAARVRGQSGAVGVAFVKGEGLR
jgi:hypothetical protein